MEARPERFGGTLLQGRGLLRWFYNRVLGLLRNMRWSGYPLHTASGIWVRNMLRKARTLSLCCGNHGQPGC